MIANIYIIVIVKYSNYNVFNVALCYEIILNKIHTKV